MQHAVGSILDINPDSRFDHAVFWPKQAEAGGVVKVFVGWGLRVAAVENVDAIEQRYTTEVVALFLDEGGTLVTADRMIDSEGRQLYLGEMHQSDCQCLHQARDEEPEDDPDRLDAPGQRGEFREERPEAVADPTRGRR